MSKRLTAKVKEIRQELKARRHEPIPQIGKWLRAVVAGYFNYHAVPGNTDALWLFRYLIGRDWKRALSRRSQRARVLWSRMSRLIDTWLPRPKVLHPYPNQRLIVNT